MKKQIIAIALVALLVISIVPMAVSAAGTLNISAGTVEADLIEGDTVSVPVSFSDNSGYGYGFINVGWNNEALELTNIEYTDVAPKKDDAAAISNDGSYTVTWGSDIATKPYTGNGLAFTLLFKITSTATAGSYDITLSNYEVYDVDIDTISGTASSGVVTLKGEETCTHSKMTSIAAKSANCTEAGNNAYYYCPDCEKYFKDKDGKTETSVNAETIPAKGHTPGAAVRENEIAAGCETKGSYDEVVYCTDCEEEISRNSKEIPATGHDWGEWIVTKEATETEEGSKTHTCKNDPTHTETVPIPVIPHVHDLEVVEGKPATCTEEGIKTYYKCKKDNCGKMFEDATANVEIVDEKDLVLAKLPHTPSEWIVDKEATEEEAGHRHKICTVCKTTIADEDYELKKATAVTVDAVPTKVFAKPILDEWFTETDGFKDVDPEKAGVSYEELCAEYLINKNMTGAKITVTFNDGTKETYTIERNCGLQGSAVMGNYLLDESMDLWMSVFDLGNFKAEIALDGVTERAQFVANSEKETEPTTTKPTEPTTTKPTDENVEPTTTKPVSSGDTAPSGGGTTGTSTGTSNGAVQTGESNIAFVAFAIMVALAGISFVVFFLRKRKNSR